MFVASVMKPSMVVGGFQSRPLKIVSFTSQIEIVSFFCLRGVRTREFAETKNIFDKANDAYVRALIPRLEKLFGVLSSLLVGERTSELSLQLVPRGDRRFMVLKPVPFCCLEGEANVLKTELWCPPVVANNSVAQLDPVVDVRVDFTAERSRCPGGDGHANDNMCCC